MKKFMKQLLTIIVTAVITAFVTVAAFMYQYGMIDVSTHTDTYVTTCNGEVINTSDRVVTDKVTFRVNVSEGFNIFTR